MARAFVRLDDDRAHALDRRTVMHRSFDFGDDIPIARMPCFEQLDDARQTAGDVYIDARAYSTLANYCVAVRSYGHNV